jgi:hypothetical protein
LGCRLGFEGDASRLQPPHFALQIGALEIELRCVRMRNRAIGQVQRERGLALRQLETRIVRAFDDELEAERCVEGDGRVEIGRRNRDLIELHTPSLAQGPETASAKARRALSSARIGDDHGFPH